MEDRGLKSEDEERTTPTFRLFVAISPPEIVKDEIEKAQRELREGLPGNVVRWTRREQFHLTLNFLGNVAEARVAELIGALREVCRPFAALRLRAERIGFFPDTRVPRVVWAWVHDDKDILPRLQEAIAARVTSFTDERAEKKFTGHVTLGRIQNFRRPQAEVLAKLAFGMAERFFGEWLASHVELIRSELSSGGSRYTTLATFPISKAT
jgi:2'-5' RNA ligase